MLFNAAIICYADNLLLIVLLFVFIIFFSLFRFTDEKNWITKLKQCCLLLGCCVVLAVEIMRNLSTNLNDLFAGVELNVYLCTHEREMEADENQPWMIVKVLNILSSSSVKLNFRRVKSIIFTNDTS